MINISFFSYKGGSGRTSLLYNTLPFLAKELNATNQEPIIVVDLDIDSKGMSYLVNENSKINAIQVLKGDSGAICGRIRDVKIEEHPFFKALVPMGALVGLDRSLNRSILFVSANATNEDNKFLDNTNNFDPARAGLESLNSLCNSFKCKAIVMDTPAGGQLAGNLALRITSKIVTVMRITKQFRKGTYEFLKEKSAKVFNKEFILVPNAVPNCEDTIYSMNNIMQGIRQDAIEHVQNNKLNLNMINDNINGVNEVKQFKFEEKNLNFEAITRTLVEDEEKAVERYKLLAKELAKDAI